jgi:hypothetical protein
MNSRTKISLVVVALASVLGAGALGAIPSSWAGSLPGASTKPHKFGILRLNRKRQFPASVIPKVKRASNADRVGGKSVKALVGSCGSEEVDVGSFCLMANPYPLAKNEVGKNNYFFATRKCTRLGGYLPSSAELIGAANRVRLASTVDDSALTASIDEDKTDGLKDRREMTSDLTTTASGSRSAGSEGVSDGSRGDPRTGEPNPLPQPANPYPETLQYVTVYDNRDRGGFAGAKPVGQTENFRCAFAKVPGGGGD